MPEVSPAAVLLYEVMYEFSTCSKIAPTWGHGLFIKGGPVNWRNNLLLLLTNSGSRN